MNQAEEFFISVDVETAGPNPGQYSLLAIGACTLGQPQKTFYVELQPDRAGSLPEAAAIHRLSLEELASRGLPPAEAMQRFADWLEAVTPAGARPVFVAFNAPFDWMFVCDYFHRYLGRNPFGHTALDIKAYAMGKNDSSWADTSMKKLGLPDQPAAPLTHHALQDAIDQGALFLRLRQQARRFGE
jgi:DNA polymerase III epsilon subunit-like protein